MFEVVCVGKCKSVTSTSSRSCIIISLIESVSGSTYGCRRIKHDAINPITSSIVAIARKKAIGLSALIVNDDDDNGIDVVVVVIGMSIVVPVFVVVAIESLHCMDCGEGDAIASFLVMYS